MKHELIKAIDRLDNQFEMEFNRYASDTDLKVNEYKLLLEKNEKNSNSIKHLTHKI